MEAPKIQISPRRAVPSRVAHASESACTRSAPLPAPGELRQRLPLSVRGGRCVEQARGRIRDLLHGRDGHRLLIVVGPCSIHDPLAALEYARRLARVQRATADALVLVMRTYYDKPRTTTGWKGLIRDPHLDGSRDTATGLVTARGLLVELLELGVPCGAELLDPLAVPYLEDLLSWSVIGARTAESQTHRELASGVALPVGFKNSTAGDVTVAHQAMTAAREPACFVGMNAQGRPAVMRTSGNPDRHLVLRGGMRPNFAPEHVRSALSLVSDQGLDRPVMVDCSHGNSGKDHRRQADAFRSVLGQVEAGCRGILGLLVESHLHPGRQDLQPGGPLRYGVSITDSCIGWSETEQLLSEAAATVRSRSRRDRRHRAWLGGSG